MLFRGLAREYGPILFKRYKSAVSKGETGKHSSIEIPSPKVTEHSLDDVKTATENANRLVTGRTTGEEDLMETQASPFRRIQSAQAGFGSGAFSEHELKDLPEALEPQKGTGRGDKREMKDRTLGKKGISTSKRIPFERILQSEVKNTRYRFDKHTGNVTDSMKSATDILGLRNRNDPFEMSSSIATLTDTISRLPLTLVVKTNSGAGSSLKIKELIDYVEEINRQYNSQNAAVDINFLDPNDYDLVLDYQILSRTDILQRYLTDDDPSSTVGARFPLDKTEVILVQITEMGFKKSSSFLHRFADYFSKKFELLACILSAPKFPVLSQIRKPNNNLTDLENEIMEDNLYVVASLGLVKVAKRKDGTLILTKRSN
ncbi:DEKNAAC100360 [Brettanomyces naardenensis]|uniref:DEKNAAC100360 n=1 Tax=Brettanomyces naardenensis TaxID=13370 RepID=A0A448YEK0_BRENA|nr:DEKNAAC100360 [Brettanomyces naardenensis]